MEDPTLSCSANIEWINSMSVTVKKIQYKNAMIKILRNDLREMFLEISQEKLTTTKIKLKDISVFKKFMSEGKASIKFNTDKASLYISNAPPGSLMFFLKTLFIKLTKEADQNKNLTKEEIQKKLRAHLLSENTGQFDEISPVTNAELDRAKKLATSKSSITTPSPPSRKRKLEGAGQLAAKRLYAPSPLAAKPKEESKNPDDPAMMMTLNDEQNSILQCEYNNHI
jgi:ATP-dependent DNA helicase PIF1